MVFRLIFLGGFLFGSLIMNMMEEVPIHVYVYDSCNLVHVFCSLFSFSCHFYPYTQFQNGYTISALDDFSLIVSDSYAWEGIKRFHCDNNLLIKLQQEKEEHKMILKSLVLKNSCCP